MQREQVADGFLTLEMAAKLLGVTVRGVRWHIYQSKRLTSELVNHRTYVKRAEVEALLVERKALAGG